MSPAPSSNRTAGCWLPREDLASLDRADADLPVPLDPYLARSQEFPSGSGTLPDLPFQFLGPDKHISHESKKPVEMVWQLRYPMPVEMFEENKRGG